jgi:5-methylcytosine-specific restriction endonuclease McrA
MVLARDNYTCQRCGKTKDKLSEEGIALHCHHLEGILWEPLESADMDQCITYCQSCHVKTHQTPDCGYHDMKCK